MQDLNNGTDLIVFSNHAFNPGRDRTSRIVSSLSQGRKVYFIENPIENVSTTPVNLITKSGEVTIVRPYLPQEISVFERKEALKKLLDEVMEDEGLSHYSIWTDTALAMPYIRNLTPEVIVYDCQGTGSHPELELELLQYADVVLGLKEEERDFKGTALNPKRNPNISAQEMPLFI